MDTIATVEGMTSGQAVRIWERFQVRCRKDGSVLPKEVVQKVLDEEMEELIAEMLAALRARVERHAKMIVRRALVNRSRTPQEAINATGRKQYQTDSVVAAMPKGQGDEVEVYFFKLDSSVLDGNGWINDTNLEKQFELRNFKPADPYSLAAVNEADPAFADKHPNATHWKDANEKWCYAAFYRWFDERKVRVDRHVIDWGGRWWFAGLRK